MSALANTLDPGSILDKVELLFGADSTAFRQVEAAYRRYEEDITKIKEAEQLGDSVIAILGKHKVGKTTLLKSIFPNSDEVGALLSGDFGTTSSLTWVTTERNAANPIEASAARISVAGCESPLSQDSITFIDTPAFGLSNEGQKECIRNALLYADIKILIVSSNDLALEHLLLDLKDAEGSVVIPVIRLTPRATNTWEEASNQEAVRKDVEVTLSRWRQHLPSMKFMEAIYVGDFDSKCQIDSMDSLQLKVTDALVAAIDDPSSVQLSKQNRIQAAGIRFRESVRSALSASIEHIKDSYEEVQHAHDTLPLAAIEYIFSEREALTAFLNWRIRQNILRDLPPVMIPIKSLWAVIVYTSGAWERLMLGMQGSILSVALAGKKSLQNISEAMSGDARFSKNLQSELNAHLRNQISPKYSEFNRDLEGVTGSGAKVTDAELSVGVSGLDSLIEKWTDQVNQQTRIAALRYDRIGGFISFGCFWYLISGPLVFLYGRQIPAVLESWSGSWEGAAQHQFPTFSLGDWTTSLLLAAAPVLLIGAIVFSCACRRKKVQAIAEHIKQELIRAQKSREIILNVTLESSKIQAADDLMKALKL